MPWNPKQHRLFCARCKGGKGSAEMCKMCHEGIKDGSKKTDWRAEERKSRG